MMSKRWVPCELHTHTVHSDAKHTLYELAEGAKKLGIECIALTDHNTISGHMEIEGVTKNTGVRIVKGMEWTTFFGHMLTMGIDRYDDWRDIGIHQVHKGSAKVHKNGGITGVAHPYRPGSPMCTGCYWQFEITDWNDMDYIEVWSGTSPSNKSFNIRAFDLWTGLLNKGIKITGVSGRDWHSSGNISEFIAVTYLYMDMDDTRGLDNAAKKALIDGNTCVSIGPFMNFNILLEDSGALFIPGNEIRMTGLEPKVKVLIELLHNATEEKCGFHVDNLYLVIDGCGGEIAKMPVVYGTNELNINISRSQKWIRAELYSDISGLSTIVAFTNPIYINGQTA